MNDIQASVFTPTCSVGGCHDGVGVLLPGVMNLTTAQNSFDNLVGVASMQVPSLSRVAAGDPANSYIIRKLEGAAAVGGRMPFGSPNPLDPALIADIRHWISNGAER